MLAEFLTGTLLTGKAVASAFGIGEGVQPVPINADPQGCSSIVSTHLHLNKDVSYSKWVDDLTVKEVNIGNFSWPVTASDGQIVFASIVINTTCPDHHAAVQLAK